MLRLGLSIPAILATITKAHGPGACCQAALVVGDRKGAGKLEAMLRLDPGEFTPGSHGDVESTVKLLASRAGNCCRGSLCQGLRTRTQCASMGTCTWHAVAQPGASGEEGECTELTAAQLLSDRCDPPLDCPGSTPLDRTQSWMQARTRARTRARTYGQHAQPHMYVRACALTHTQTQTHAGGARAQGEGTEEGRP